MSVADEGLVLTSRNPGDEIVRLELRPKGVLVTVLLVNSSLYCRVAYVLWVAITFPTPFNVKIPVLRAPKTKEPPKSPENGGVPVNRMSPMNVFDREFVTVRAPVPVRIVP